MARNWTTLLGVTRPVMEPSLAWWKLYVWVSVLFDVMFVGFLVVYRRVCACGYCLRMVALCDV